MSTVAAEPPSTTERAPLITGEAEDIRRELEEMADLAYREHHPFPGNPPGSDD